MMRVELHDETRTELAASAHHYDGEVPGLGARYLDQMWHGIGRILDSPHIGSPQRKKLRKLVTSGPFRYSIIYADQGRLDICRRVCESLQASWLLAPTCRPLTRR